MTILMLASALLAAGFSWLIGSGAQPIGQALGLLDWPDRGGGRKRHASVTPLVGGLALVGVSTLAGCLSLWLGNLGATADIALTVLIAVTLLMAAIGMADDRFALTPRIRLALAMLVLSLAMIVAPDFSLDFLRFTGQAKLWLLGSFGFMFTLLCLIGLLNAVNMADGKNGLVISLALGWTLVLLVHAPAQLRPLLLAVAVALAILFGFNMRGRLFLGDGGSYGISTLIGLSAVYCYNHAFAEMRADALALLFAVPVADTVRLMATRMLRGLSPFSPGRDHLHHHLAWRWGWPRGLAIYLALVWPSNLLGVLMPSLVPLWLALTLAAYAMLLYVTRRAPSEEAGFLPGDAAL
jgi:UDP-GlcNAc:undecaprenyl-phosphate/decaprenyl-phosphate GlcNAc-1-phosphate transferase